MPRQKTPDYSKWALIGLVSGAALLFAYAFKQMRNNQIMQEMLAQHIGQRQVSPKPALHKVNGTGANGRHYIAKNDPNATTGAGQRPGPRPNPTDEFRKELKKESERALKHFTDVAKIHLPLPMQMQFKPYDFDEDVEAIHGFDSANNTNLTALAYGKDATPEQALQYFREEGRKLPNLEGLKNIGQAQALPPPSPNSGMKSGTMWSGHLNNGDEVHVVLMRRSDSQGSYMFVYSGPQKYFKGSDGAFDELYDQIRALPPR